MAPARSPWAGAIRRGAVAVDTSCLVPDPDFPRYPAARGVTVGVVIRLESIDMGSGDVTVDQDVGCLQVDAFIAAQLRLHTLLCPESV
jgi:hypothetical protein